TELKISIPLRDERLTTAFFDLGPDPAALTDLVGQCPREQGLR
ncbi:MAG: hypothetical protein JWL62_96, partial [Hyphomicrobiales bacterium]|nr:hypothetical protein [Hyphomicrobiales bacterium]